MPKASPPTAPVWVSGFVDTVGQEVEPRRGVPFLQCRVRVRGRPRLCRIQRAEWTVLLAKMLVEPLKRGQRLITTKVHAAVSPFALVLAGRMLGEDVEQIRKVFEQPALQP